MKSFRTFSFLLSAVAALYFGVRVIASGDQVIYPVGLVIVIFGVLMILVQVFCWLQGAGQPVQPEFFIELFRANVDQYPALLDQAAVMMIGEITEIDKKHVEGP